MRSAVCGSKSLLTTMWATKSVRPIPILIPGVPPAARISDSCLRCFTASWCAITREVGHECGKKNAQLCKKRTFQEAFDFLENHLKVSPKHAKMVTAEKREEFLRSACIQEDEEDYCNLGSSCCN